MPYYFAENAYPRCKNDHGWRADSKACPSDGPLQDYADFKDMEKTMEQIDYAVNVSKPFFLAFGTGGTYMSYHHMMLWYTLL